MKDILSALGMAVLLLAFGACIVAVPIYDKAFDDGAHSVVCVDTSRESVQTLKDGTKIISLPNISSL